MINKNMIYKNWKAGVAIFTAAALLGGSALALSNTTAPAENKVSTLVESISAKDDTKLSKDETVYVLCDANGSKSQVIVSDHLKNMLNSQNLKDVSNLTDIYNTNGDEAFTADANGELNWTTEGNDIYYRGTTEEALPVDVIITYTLDGKDISPENLAGKSGHVTMHIAYENKKFETVKLGDKDTKIYVPFLTASGMLLDNEVFTNIKITNGKLIDDGLRTVAVGISFPGLNENLGLDLASPEITSNASLKLPDYMEIEADVTNFSFEGTMTVATNEIFNQMELSMLDVSNASDMVNELTAGIAKIVDGSGSLYEGLDTLLTKVKELKTGVDTLTEGGKTLSAGAKDLANGSASLSSGSNDLAAGASKVDDGAQVLAAGANQLNSGAKDLANGANAASTGAKTLAAGSKQLADGSAELAAGLKQLSDSSATLNAGALQVFNTLLDTAYAQITASGVQIPKLTADNYGLVLDQVIAQASMSQEASAAEVVKTLKALKASLDNYKQFYSGVLTYTSGVDIAAAGANGVSVGAKDLYSGAKDLSGGLSTLNDGAKALSSGASDLSNGANTLKAGTSALKSGANTLNKGAADVSNGAKKLSDGAKSLYDGLTKLQSNMPTLIEGVTALRNGSSELYQGLSSVFSEKLTDMIKLYGNDITGLVDRVQATVDVSKSYKSFSGISDEMDGTVRFIYKTDAVKAAQSDK